MVYFDEIADRPPCLGAVGRWGLFGQFRLGGKNIARHLFRHIPVVQSREPVAGQVRAGGIREAGPNPGQEPWLIVVDLDIEPEPTFVCAKLVIFILLAPEHRALQVADTGTQATHLRFHPVFHVVSRAV